MVFTYFINKICFYICYDFATTFEKLEATETVQGQSQTFNYYNYTLSKSSGLKVILYYNGANRLTFTKKFFLFNTYKAGCGILVPQPGIKPRSRAVKVLNLSHWTTRETSSVIFLQTEMTQIENHQAT